MSEIEMIEVIITAEQRVFYRQQRKIPKALYDKYEAMRDAGENETEFDRTFGDLIDRWDVGDANDLEDVTIEVVAFPPATPMNAEPRSRIERQKE
jgi:hypothetical protein